MFSQHIFIRNKQSGLFVQVKRSSKKDGAYCVLHEYSGMKHQQWIFETATGHLQNVFNGMYLDVTHSFKPEIITTQKNSTSLSQQWQQEGSKLKNKNGKYLDTLLGATSNDARMIAWFSTSFESQNYEFVKCVPETHATATITTCLPIKKAVDADEKRLDIAAAYFSWVAYDHKLGGNVGKMFSDQDDEDKQRLKDMGTWTIRNEFHFERDLQNAHAILVDNQDLGVVIVAYRGTEFRMDDRIQQSFNDWIFGNCKVKLIPWSSSENESKHGRVHKGFFVHYSTLEHGIKLALDSYVNAGYRIVVTGHSQGAAQATLLALDMFIKYPLYASKMHLYTFGSPRVGNKKWKEFFESHVAASQCMHFVCSVPHTNEIVDMVCNVPPEFLGYQHVHGTRLFTKVNMDYASNLNPISKIDYKCKMPAYAPNVLLAHAQRMYCDGLIFDGTLDKPFLLDKPAAITIAEISEKMNAEITNFSQSIKTFFNSNNQ